MRQQYYFNLAQFNGHLSDPVKSVDLKRVLVRLPDDKLDTTCRFPVDPREETSPGANICRQTSLAIAT